MVIILVEVVTSDSELRLSVDDDVLVRIEERGDVEVVPETEEEALNGGMEVSGIGGGVDYLC